MTDDKTHGSRTSYRQGCRCKKCTIANRTYARAYKARRAAGEGRICIPCDEATAHVRWLKSQGVSITNIAEAAGIGKTSVAEFYRGERTVAKQPTIDAILAVTLSEAMVAGKTVPKAEAVRVFEAIKSSGLTHKQLTAVMGLSNWTNFLYDNKHVVYKRNYDRCVVLLKLLGKAGKVSPEVVVEVCGT